MRRNQVFHVRQPGGVRGHYVLSRRLAADQGHDDWVWRSRAQQGIQRGDSTIPVSYYYGEHRSNLAECDLDARFRVGNLVGPKLRGKLSENLGGYPLNASLVSIAKAVLRARSALLGMPPVPLAVAVIAYRLRR